VLWATIPSIDGDIPLTKIENQKFEGVPVILDGYHYVKCTFINCQLVFGGGYYNLVECNIIPGCAVGLTGMAQNTLNFLSSVYRANQQGKELIEMIFQSIRNGLPPQPPPAPLPEMPKGPVN
jgi:hypothetical protein